MVLTGSPSDLALLRSLSPLDGMKAENLIALARNTKRLVAPKNRVLFCEGDEDRQTFYLLSGTIDLLEEGEIISSVAARTPKAKYPLAHVLPRAHSAVVTSPQAEYLCIDSEFLDVAVTMDQTGTYHVAELRPPEDTITTPALPQNGDWMTALLSTKAFHKVPPAHLQAVFMRLQRFDCRAGEVVVRQGDAGDYFYIVVKGRLAVTRETPLNKEGVKLAELQMGDTFGEEALISETRRNANVVMLTDGCLMRLGKDDFRNLLNEPFLDWVDYADAKDAVAAGGQWLDVRMPSEFEQYHAPGAINIPLYSLRMKMRALDRDVHYITCCDTGRRSSACSYILSERGYNASVLRGGLSTTELARR